MNIILQLLILWIGKIMPNKLYVIVILVVVAICGHMILAHQQVCTTDSETEIVDGVALTTNTVSCGAEKYQELLVNGKYGGKPI